MEIALGIILLVLAVALIILILLQQSKDKNLSSSIAGGSDTFFGKSKSVSKDKMLSIATSVIAVLFVLIVITMYLLL